MAANWQWPWFPYYWYPGMTFYYPASHVPPTWQPSGWQCPKCGRVHAPSVLGCEDCNKAVKENADANAQR